MKTSTLIVLTADAGLINSVGNLGGFVGPYVVGDVNTATNSFFGGLLSLAVSALVAAGLVLALRQGGHKTGVAEIVSNGQ
jgi:nitrate/nitrite transporter NarK